MSEAVFGDAPSDFQEKLWTLCTKDHQGHPVELAWVLRDDNVPRYSKPSLPFQVYILDTAPRTIKFGNLPELLARWMDWASVFQPLQRTMCHFEIYRSPFPNVLACIDHQREEIKHRNSREGWSHLVENWADFYLCESCPWNMGYILVIDRDDWTAEGALHVKFAQTSHSQAITTDHAEQCTDLGPPISVHATRNRTTYEFFLTLLKRRRLFENGRKWHAKSASLVRSYGDEIEDFGEDYVDEQTFQTRLEQRRQEARKNREQRRTEYLAECVLSRTRLSTNEQLPGLIVHNYFDDMNWPVSNVWDARHNGRRPELSFTLYLADDTPPVSPQALYTLLHQDAPEDSSWSLDIVWQTTCISTAMQHYSYEAHGWPGRRATARHCLSKFRKQVFRRAVGHIFPEELLQNILDLSSMRRPRKEDLNPTYDSRPHVFMYLDAKSFCSGPQIVIADPQVINSKTITPDDEREVHLKAPWVSSDFADGFHTALEVSHWRSWATVADRLHTLWSLRASRSFKIEEQQLPYFVLDIQVADFCSPRPHGSVDAALRVPPSVQFFLTLHGCAQSVAVYRPVLPESFIFDCVTITDVETGCELDLTQLSKVPGMALPTNFKLDERIGWSCKTTWKAFEPEIPERISYELHELKVLQEWWYNLLALNKLIHGRSYRMGIKEGLRIERWTFGTASKLKGPLNLPPIRLKPGKATSFIYELHDA